MTTDRNTYKLQISKCKFLWKWTITDNRQLPGFFSCKHLLLNHVPIQSRKVCRLCFRLPIHCERLNHDGQPEQHESKGESLYSSSTKIGWCYIVLIANQKWPLSCKLRTFSNCFCASLLQKEVHAPRHGWERALSMRKWAMIRQIPSL